MTKEELMEKLDSIVPFHCRKSCAYYDTDSCCDAIKNDVESLIRCSELNEEPSVFEQAMRFGESSKQDCDFMSCDEETQENDPVNHPAHYCFSNGAEVIDITENLNFCRGNAVKYLCRAGRKLDELEDLKKARFYVEREIKRLEAMQNNGC